MNGFRGPLWFAIALIVILGGIAVWFFMQPNQTVNIAVQLASDPTNVMAGDEFTIDASFANDSAQTLQNATISLVLPDGVISLDSPNQRVVQQPLGNISPSGVSHQSFHIIATNSPNTVLHFTGKLLYNITNSTAKFENDGNIDIVLGLPAVNVSVSAPGSVFSGQNFPIAVTYQNNTDHEIDDLSLAMQYPPAFSFTSAAAGSLATTGNSAWSLGALQPNASGTIKIIGNLVGPNGASYPIMANLAKTISGQAYNISSPTANVVLAASPLGLTIKVNNSSGTVANPGDTLSYTISFANNSNVALQNSTINAKLSGKMFDFSTLVSNGSFNSVANTISWNAASVPALLSLAPGQSGSVTFSVRAKPTFPIRLLSDKNYTLGVQVNMQSLTVPPGTAASSTISIANLTTKLAGKIALAAKAYHDSGPYPPRVNQATQYAIHWLVTNYATDANNVTISASLQSGTTCTGKNTIPASAASSTFNCNSSNGQVSWTIPTVPATTGITGKPLELVFQVTNTPAVNQVNQDVTLVGPVTLTATDAFTGGSMQATAQAITTALPDDTNYSPSMRRSVTQ